MRHNDSNVGPSRYSSLPALPGWLIPVGAIVVGSLALGGCDGGRISFGDDAGGVVASTNGGAGGSSASAGASAIAGASGSAGGAAPPTPGDLDVGSGDDPLDVHPWPMAHRSAGNVASGSFDTGTDIPFVRWATPLPGPGEAVPQIRPLVSANGQVFVVTTQAIVVVDAQGELVAQIPSARPRGIALAKNGDLFVSDDDGVARFDLAAPAAPLWRRALQRPIGAWVESSPIVAPGGDVFVVDAGQDLLRLSAAAGAVAWRVSLPAPTLTPALAPAGHLYVVVTGEDGGPRGYDAAGNHRYTGKGAGFLSPPVIDVATSSVVFARQGSPLRRTLLGATFGGPGDAFGPSGFRATGSLPVRTRLGWPSPAAPDLVESFVLMTEWDLAQSDPRLPALSAFTTAPAPATPEPTSIAPESGASVTMDPFLWSEEPLLAAPAASIGGSTVVGSPSGGLDFYLRYGYPAAGGLSQHGPTFRVDHEVGARVTPPSPSLGPNGDVYFVAAEGLLYRLGTTANPCGEPAMGPAGYVTATPAHRVDVAVGETVLVQHDLGGTASGAANASVVVDGQPVPVLPGAYADQLRFDMPEVPLPPGGRAVQMSVTTDGGTVSFCRRVIPRRPTRGARPTVTQVSSPGGASTALPVISSNLVIDGAGFVLGRAMPSPAPGYLQPAQPLLEVRVCLGEGRRLAGSGSAPPSSDVGRCHPVEIVARSEQQLEIAVPGLTSPEVVAELAPNGEDVPLVVRLEAPFSGHPVASFAFRARLTPP